jgi:hypothetical protein
MSATKKFALALILLIIASAFTINSVARVRFSIAFCDPQNQMAYILYYGNGCPHCKIAEEYIIANDFQEKIGICGKEIWSDRTNQNDIIEKAKVCGIELNQLGVPMLWDSSKQKCYVGDQPIIDFLKQQAGI